MKEVRLDLPRFAQDVERAILRNAMYESTSGAMVWKSRPPQNRRQPESLRAAAATTGVSATTLHRVSGGLCPSVRVFAKLCVWMGKSMDSYIASDQA